MGIEALGVAVVLFLSARVMKQVSQRAGEGSTPPMEPRAPGDAPQTMAELWQEMREQLEAARRQQTGEAELPAPVKKSGPTPRLTTPKRLPAPKARFPVPVPVERGGSIEVASREASLPELDQDDGAEALVQRRIDAATARNGEWTMGDHTRFDAKIRATIPVTAEVRKRHPLRQAMIWREVLSPPVSLRDREEI